MRIWSLHPTHLDTKGLVALWRETLLAKHVLEGKTRGYKNHPQLIRFKSQLDPLSAINQYLSIVYEDSLQRNFNFNKNKIDWNFNNTIINVTNNQVDFEKNHLLQKLKKRDVTLYNQFINESNIKVHPIFSIINGDIES